MNKEIEHECPEKPIITPEESLNCEGIDPNQYKFEKALLAFTPIRGMQDRFNGKTTKKQIFTPTVNYWVREEEAAILIGPIYGGPLYAIILEELSVFGVKYAVGYGFSGSLVDDIAPGSIMVAESGFCSDGTSKEYTQESEVFPDKQMLYCIKDIIESHSINPEIGKVWTTDALYREFPSKIGYWKRKGAKFVNMDTSPFYAVARSKGIKAVYLSIVSDNVSKEEWSGWSLSAIYGKAVKKMWGICLEMLETL
jgi:uridine phosphorylase